MKNLSELFNYEGKNVVITGAASGIAMAAAELLINLGAEAYAIDIKEITLPVKKCIYADLSKKDSIDAAIEQLPAKIDSIFSCHGMSPWPNRNVEVVLCNFVGQRHLVESLIPRIVDKGSVAFISSIGGSGWQMSWKKVSAMLETKDFEEAQEWLKAHEKDSLNPEPYTFSKMCLIAYVKTKAWAPEFIKRKIRINAISPGLIKTPMVPDLAAIGPYTEKDLETMFLEGWDGRYAKPEEIGYPLVFLNSNMASYISGHNLVIDYGLTASSEIDIVKSK